MKVDVYIEGERLDLFNDESISITQGVQDVKDISKLFADFSQSFTVPASDNNNRIFKHYYNADIDGGFDARTRKLATIDVNTLDFKRGKIQLESVEIKDGEPANYKVTFFGDAIKIKDLLGDDKLFDLDYLSNFDHDYDETQVQNGLINGLDFTVDSVLYERAIIYPLISYTRQYLYDSDVSDTTSTDTLVNIAYDAGRSDGVKFSDLKPAIKLSLIVQAIEEKYGFNFTGGFFDSLDYQELYMGLNNSTEVLSNGILEIENVSGSGGGETALSDDIRRYAMAITPKPGFESVPYKIKLEVNGTVLYEDQEFLSGARSRNGKEDTPAEDYNCVATVITEQDFEFDAITELTYETNIFTQQLFRNIYNNLVIDLKVRIRDLIYDVEVYDFITSLFKMFNLVVVAEGTDLIVEDLQTWYSKGQIYDISKYVDTKKLKVTKGKVFNQIDFKFEESEQILADQFNKNNRIFYGNLENKIYADETQTTLLDGEKLNVEVIFERPVNERLLDLNDNSLTTVQYCPYFDRDIKSITGNPFLFYAESQDITANNIGFKGVTAYSEINTFVFMPSQSRNMLSSDSFSVNFSAELSEFTYQSMWSNIYSKYYRDYISDMFSIKRRNYELEAILPDSLLHSLKLNDRLIIADRRYIINKITSNLVKRKDSLELINDIYDAPLASDATSGGAFRRFTCYYESPAYSDNVQYLGDSTTPAVLVDTGDGTSWITIDDDPRTTVRTLTFNITENTGTTRRADIRITNVNKTVANFTVVQNGLIPLIIDIFDDTFDTTFK